MTTPRLIDARLPDFGVPETMPRLPTALYEGRFLQFRRRIAEAGLDSAVVYADREHFAGLAYLIGFEPRFEEALLVLRGTGRPLVMTGPENAGLARLSRIDVDVVVYPSFGLIGQDRRGTPALADVLRSRGLAAGDTVGTLGWKYFTDDETPAPEAWIELPSFVVETLRGIVAPTGRVVNATRLLMDPSTGLRAVNEVDQIAQFEFASCHSSEAVKAVLFGIAPGLREYEAARLMRPIGLPLSCHTMLSTGPDAALGLCSPSDRVIGRGEPVTTCVGYWGALTSRAGWLAAEAGELPEGVRDYVEKLAGPYFACAAEWHETVGIGVSGGAIDAMVKRHLGDPFFGVLLNPGHLIHLDEWLSTPIYPGSTEVLQSGQALQCDIIPATGTAYFTSNIEDGIALLDARGRDEFAERHPEAWRRIGARRAFMADVLGIRAKPEVLHLSNIPAYLPPFVLSPGRVLARA